MRLTPGTWVGPYHYSPGGGRDGRSVAGQGRSAATGGGHQGGVRKPWARRQPSSSASSEKQNWPALWLTPTRRPSRRRLPRRQAILRHRVARGRVAPRAADDGPHSEGHAFPAPPGVASQLKRRCTDGLPSHAVPGQSRGSAQTSPSWKARGPMASARVSRGLRVDWSRTAGLLSFLG